MTPNKTDACSKSQYHEDDVHTISSFEEALHLDVSYRLPCELRRLELTFEPLLQLRLHCPGAEARLAQLLPLTIMCDRRVRFYSLSVAKWLISCAVHNGKPHLGGEVIRIQPAVPSACCFQEMFL